MHDTAPEMVTVADAEASARRFWQWCNTTGGLPEHYPDEEAVRFLMPYKGKALKVLDLGSGSGKNLVMAAELGFRVSGVDYSQPGLDYTRERLKERGLAAELACADFTREALPYPDESFDLVMAIQMFDHVLDVHARRLLREVRRVLKPKGRMLATLMSDNTNRKSRVGHPLEGESLTMLVSSGNSAGEIHRLFRAEQMEAFLRPHFEVLRSTTIASRDDQTGETSEARYFILERKGNEAYG